MKRFCGACAFALAMVWLTAGCNDYGNTFQNPTGAVLSSLSPANAAAGSGDFTLTLFGSRFVTKTVVQWNGKNLATTVVTDSNSNILYVTALVPAALITKPGLVDVNTLNPHSGSTDNGLSNTIAFVINPAPNPLPVVTSISPATAAPGSPSFSLAIAGSSFIPSTDPTGGSVVNWTANGTQTTLTATSVTASAIQATVPASLLAAQTCAIVSVYNPPAQATIPPSGVSNPYSGGGGTAANTPGFAVTTDPNFQCPPTSPNSAKATAAAVVAEETPALGADGRYVAYTAMQNGHAQIFLRDTCTGGAADCQPRTELLSFGADGAQGNADSNTPAISADGRFIAFSSAATNLVAGAPSGRQIYLRDTCTGAAGACTPRTTLISQDDSGTLAGNDNLLPSVSSSGRFVAFLSVTPSKYPTKPGAANSGYRQVMVRDTCFGAAGACTPKTTRISLLPGDTTSLQSKPAGPAISSSAQAVGVASSTPPTLFTRSVSVDDRVFLALTNHATNQN